MDTGLGVGVGTGVDVGLGVADDSGVGEGLLVGVGEGSGVLVGFAGIISDAATETGSGVGSVAQAVIIRNARRARLSIEWTVGFLMITSIVMQPGGSALLPSSQDSERIHHPTADSNLNT